MSTGNMPNPPDQPTTQASPPPDQTQAAEAAQAAEAPEPAGPTSLGADMARIIEEQIDLIAQRHLYNAQTMYGVSGIGTDIVSARTAALVIAGALRDEAHVQLEHALINLGDPQTAQVNDRTLPYRYNSQVAGLLEGILIDTVSLAYRDDPTRRREARVMLERLFQPANEQLQLQPNFTPAFPSYSEERPQIAGPETTPNP